MTVDQVIAAVTSRTGITWEQIQSRSRPADVVHARQLAMWLIRHSLDWSYPQIGQLFARDHTTVIHAVARINGARRANPGLRNWLDRYASAFTEVDQ